MSNRNILVGFLLLVGCRGDGPIYVVDEIDEKAIILKNWHVIGPFETEEDEIGLDIDYLDSLGKEDLITYKEFVKLDSLSFPSSVRSRRIAAEENVIDFNKIFAIEDDGAPHAVVYAGCVIKSRNARRLKLNFSSDDGAKIWLNHTLIFADERGAAITPYHNYIDLSLEEGDNFLFIKVANAQNAWAMFAALEEESEQGLRRHKVNFELQYGNTFLSQNIIENDTVKLTWGIPEQPYKLKISGVQDTVFDIAPNQMVDIATLADGMYTAMLYTTADTFTSKFYKTKNFQYDIQKLITNIDKLSNGISSDNVNALLHRFNILMMPKNLPGQGFQKRSWDRRMLFVFENLKNEYALLRSDEKNTDFKGTLLKSYRSEIDNGSQFYILHVPKSYNKNVPMPLVIEVSKLMKWFPSQVETNRFANIDLIERFSDMADKHHMIVVEPGNRTVDKTNYNNIDEADMWETIADIRKTYNIDTTRVFLRGACRASYEAVKLAVKHPDRFAAIVTVAPEIIPHDKQDEDYWQRGNNPFNFLENIKDMPFLNIHSVLDTHSTIHSSDRLNELVKQAGLKSFSYRKLYTEFKTYYSDEYMDDIFQFFARSPSLKQPHSVQFKTDQLKYNRSFWIELNHIVAQKTATIDAQLEGNTLSVKHANVLSYNIDLFALPYDKSKPLTIYDNGNRIYLNEFRDKVLTMPASFNESSQNYKTLRVEGPFAHVFHNAFIFVKGTSGTPEESLKINETIERLNADWRYRYYTDFRIKPDTALTDDDLANFNVVLVGSPGSNQLIEKFIEDMPFTVKKDFISIGSKTQQGKYLGFYLIYPNPINRERYIAILGFNNPGYFSLWRERSGMEAFHDVSDFGWYDYKIWDNRDPTRTLSGYFNEEWK